MLSFFQTIWTEAMTRANFSFLILIVGAVDLTLTIKQMRKPDKDNKNGVNYKITKKED